VRDWTRRMEAHRQLLAEDAADLAARVRVCWCVGLGQHGVCLSC
jgi:hypothetical protein